MMRKLVTIVAALLALCVGAAMAEVGLANPWMDTTAEALKAEYGLELGVPEGATNVAWRVLPAKPLGEMTFTWYDMDYTARIAPTEGFEDISGIYVDWENQSEWTVGRCAAVCYRGRDGENMVDLCLWYDELTGMMYSVSTEAKDLDGFDILASAEQLYIPLQSE